MRAAFEARVAERMETLTGTCPGCETPVRWRAWKDVETGRFFPAGRPYCARCVAVEQAALEAVTTVAPPADPVASALRAGGANLRDHGGLSLSELEVAHPQLVGRLRGWLDAIASGAAVRDLFLVGPTGAGKTQLAVSTMRELLEREGLRSGVRIDLWASLLPRLHAHAYDREGDELVRAVASARLWVLDDLGDDPPTAGSVRALNRLLRTRERPTIITGNRSLRELAVRYQDVEGMPALISMLGPARVEVVEVSGRDWRGRR